MPCTLHPLQTGNVERNLAKIFQDKVKGFKPPTQFTQVRVHVQHAYACLLCTLKRAHGTCCRAHLQAAIVGAVVGIGLKSFVESIRLQTLGRAGLQQLQLDCQCLRLMLGSCAGAEVRLDAGACSCLAIGTCTCTYAVRLHHCNMRGHPRNAPQVADNLLQEVVTAAVERSLDPTLLEPAILDRILGALPGPGEQHS